MASNIKKSINQLFYFKDTSRGLEDIFKLKHIVNVIPSKLSIKLQSLIHKVMSRKCPRYC